MNSPPTILLRAALIASFLIPMTGQCDLNPLKKSVEELDGMILKANRRLEKLQANPAKAIPSIVLANAEGIVIIRKVKAGLGIGGEAGNGVALVRNPETGRWSPPAFVTAVEGTWGIQMGAQSIDLFMILLTRESLSAFANGSGLNIGVDVQAAVGPIDVGGDFDTDSIKTPVYIYTDAAGLFAGAAFKGGVLAGAKNRNVKYYGQTLPQILFDTKAKVSPAGSALIETIEYFGGPQPKEE